MLDEHTIRKVARLARIKVNEDEVAYYTAQVSGIVKWIEQLGELNTDNIEPLINPLQTNQPLRDDVVNDGNCVEAVMANAPDSLENFYVVPKVVE
jgi:aspartyl-tRNA(Asn)/glutamyl-tRNA(Gln) amidotransferase subunit C